MAYWNDAIGKWVSDEEMPDYEGFKKRVEGHLTRIHGYHENAASALVDRYKDIVEDDCALEYHSAATASFLHKRYKEDSKKTAEKSPFLPKED